MSHKPKAQQPSWFDLFPINPLPSESLGFPMRLVTRRSEPLLLIPDVPRLAVASLDLYPAQTRIARAARTLLRIALKAGLTFVLQPVQLNILKSDPYFIFLATLSKCEPISQFSGFAILAGNPAASGQRFIFLVFGSNNTPKAVVKVGMGNKSRALIHQEKKFLTTAPSHLLGMPKLLDSFESDKISAFALTYFPGRSPRLGDQHRITPLLTSWIDDQRIFRIGESPLWQRLEAVCKSNPIFSKLAVLLADCLVHPTVFHGDFAPWNIKVLPEKDWVVLDWERAELNGVPGWDWFHYVIQTAVLVERKSTNQIISRLTTLLNLPVFTSYAAAARICGIERPLVLAYLFYVIEVCKPTEGLPNLYALLEKLAAIWVED